MARKLFQLSLAEKGLALLAFPALLQIILTVGWLMLSFATHINVTNSITKTESYQMAAQYGLSCYAVLDTIRRGLASPTSAHLNEPVEFKYVAGFDNNLAQLGIKWTNQQRQWHAAEIQLARLAASPRRSWPEEAQQIARLYDQCRRNFLWLAESDKERTGRDPVYRARERRFWSSALTVASMVDLGFFLIAGFLFSAHVVRRLSVVVDNSSRLARKEPLNAPVQGADEIARLDKAFHQMADALKEATRTEEAMVENASNLILSMDLQGRILFANSGGLSLLGYSSADMTGRYLTDLIVASEVEQAKAVRELKAITGETTASEFSFETIMLHKDGRAIDTLLSGTWSGFEQTLFCVVHEIAERKAAERLQHEVIQVVGQGLLEPLTSVQQLHHRLATGQLGCLNDKGLKTLSIIGGSTQRMLDLIDDLLVYDRAGQGTLALNITTLKIDSLLRQAIESTEILANEKGVGLQSVDTSLTINADGKRLMQVLLNLLSNALKYTPSGKKVTLWAEQAAGHICIRVSDQGTGIAPEALPHVFDRFRQSTLSDATVYGGSGIGLAICKTLVELHGGHIEVESAVGQGTTFSFYIPEGLPCSLKREAT